MRRSDLDARYGEHKHDLEALRAELKRDPEAQQEGHRRDTRELELRLKNELTLRIGAMITGAVAVIAVLMRLL